MRLTSVLYLLYVIFIPLEALIVFEGVGSISRIIGYLLVFVFVLQVKIKYSIIPKVGYSFLIFLLLSFLWSVKVDIEQGFRIIMYFIFTLITGNIVIYRPKVFWFSLDLFAWVVGVLAINTFVGFLNTHDRFDSSELGLAPVSLLFVVSAGIQLMKLKLHSFNVYALILIFLNLLGIIATGTRAAWLAILILLFLFFYQNSRARQLFTSLIILCLTYILISVFFSELFIFIENRVSLLEQDRGANRLTIWKVAIEMWKDKPLFGFGYRNFANSFSFEYINKTEISELEYNMLTLGGTSAGRGSHSDYVSVIVELGLFGFILFFYWLKKLFVYFKENKILYLPLVGVLIMSFFQDNINQKVFWWMLGMAATFPRSNNFKNA